MSGTPLQCGDATVRTQMVVETINGTPNCKVLQNTALGFLYLSTSSMQQTPTEAAFGTYELWFNTPGVARLYWMPIASSIAAWNAATQNGYLVTFSQGQIALYRVTAGVAGVTLCVSAVGLYLVGEWYKFTMPRTTAAVFSCYLNNSLYPATGGGNNPTVADATFVSAPYQIYQSTVAIGVKIAWSCPSGNIGIRKGVIAE